jgi:hypothetical protein
MKRGGRSCSTISFLAAHFRESISFQINELRAISPPRSKAGSDATEISVGVLATCSLFADAWPRFRRLHLRLPLDLGLLEQASAVPPHPDAGR